MNAITNRRAFIGVCAIAVMLGAVGLGRLGSTSQADETVTVFLVRHAEKLLADKDPELSPEGHARAAKLGAMLADQPIEAVYVTRTKRSLQTGAPTAEAAGITPTEYAPMDMDALVRLINSTQPGGSVLVVAHSNTLPMVLKALGGKDIPELDESVYDRFIAIVREDGEHVKTIELRF